MTIGGTGRVVTRRPDGEAIFLAVRSEIEDARSRGVAKSVMGAMVERLPTTHGEEELQQARSLAFDRYVDHGEWQAAAVEAVLHLAHKKRCIADGVALLKALETDR